MEEMREALDALPDAEREKLLRVVGILANWANEIARHGHGGWFTVSADAGRLTGYRWGVVCGDVVKEGSPIRFD